MRKRHLCSLFVTGLCLSSMACTAEEPVVPDAGLTSTVDAAVTGIDSGVVDMGVADAGVDPVEAGVVIDAQQSVADSGVVFDAGAEPVDPLDALLDSWFANYNEGQDLSYLETPGFAFPDGDPEMEDLPTHRYYQGAAYGPFSRNLLDFWQPVSDQPTPVVVFIHGGGFTGGSRTDLRENSSISRFLNAGIAVASISYRWAYRNAAPALRSERPNNIGEAHDRNGTRIDYILRDCARSIQYLRYRARDWNINPERVGAWGGSAGAGCSMWTGTVPDLAQADHADPVLRESSRLRVIGHNYGQPTYAFDRWAALLGFSEQWLARRLGPKQVSVTQMTAEDFLGTEEGRRLSRVLDYYEHLDANDPPFITTNQTENLPQNRINQGWQILHHVRGHYALYDRCQELGGRCAIKTRERNEGFESDLIAFLIEHLNAD